jgi:hypothetical protein
MLFLTIVLGYCQEMGSGEEQPHEVYLACFGTGYEKESLSASGETDLDPTFKLT